MSARLCSYDSASGVFTPAECDAIRELGAKLTLEDAQTNSDKTGNELVLMKRNCEIKWVRAGHEGWDWVFERINEHAHALNNKRWNFAVNDIERVQYTSYGLGEFYAAHFDNGTKATQHRKLSISVQISPPSAYVGGALRFWSMNDTRHAPKEQGSMTCFPSYLMHVAKPVWWGRREVLVTWMRGDDELK